MVPKLSVPFLVVYTLMINGRSSAQDIGTKPKAMARIGNGKMASLGQFPYVVHYQIYLTKNGKHSCNGAIISPNWVLTAAHCFAYNGKLLTENRLKVMAGTIDTSETDTPSLQERQSAQVITHNTFTMANPRRWDVALIRVDKPFVFNENVQPITMMDEPLKPTEENSCTMMGFGMTEHGKNTRLFYMYGTAITCSEYHKTFNWRVEGYEDAENVCVVVEKLDTSTCHGDSGGPLVCAGKLTGTLTGRAGLNVEICGNDRENFAIYQSTAHFYSWIRKHMALNRPGVRSIQHSNEKKSNAGSNDDVSFTILTLPLLVYCSVHNELST